MKRLVPVELLLLLEGWLAACHSCTKWDNSWSQFFMLNFIRQGSVLSPLLFAVYVDDLVKSCSNNCGVYVILYADDILLISLSVCMLQNMLTICECELQKLDLVINAKKSF